MMDTIQQVILHLLFLLALHPRVEVLPPGQAAPAESPLWDRGEGFVFLFVDLQTADGLFGFVANFLHFSWI